MTKERKLRVGDWVKIRSKEEILRTLDSEGRLGGMPFMPEMFEFCGRRLQVYKVAHKTCDYSSTPFSTRRLKRTVHLDTRCNGRAHGGCQAGCLLFWKEDWLAPSEETIATKRGNNRSLTDAPFSDSRCTEHDLWQQVSRQSIADESPTYVCQMTEVPAATEPLAWWDLRQYVADYSSGNVPLRRLLSGLVYWIYYSFSESGIGAGRPMRWLYDLLSPLWGGPLFPRKVGTIPKGRPTPMAQSNLQPGERVRVKPHSEILKTVDTANKNRGMHWDAELVPYCGGEYTVRDRVTRIIGERTGKIQELKNPCIILESVVCQARYSSCRMFCPKSMYPFWREVWLERIGPDPNRLLNQPAGSEIAQSKDTIAEQLR